MIQEIELTNWRSHSESRLQFRAGTNLLVGDMGSGKSSVLSAICFALFGTFPDLERRKLKLEDTIRIRSAKARVRMAFGWNGSVYRIERGMEQNKRGISSEATISKEDRLIDHGAVAVTRYVEQLLGVDYDLFTRAIYSEQNHVDYFLTLDPRKRKEEMDRLLGLDKFETVRSNLVSLANQVRTERKTWEEKLDRQKLADMKKSMEQCQKEYRQKLEERTQTELVAKESEMVRQTAEKEFLRIRKQREEWEKIKTEYMKLEARVEHAERELKEVKEPEYATLREQYVQLEEGRTKWYQQQKDIEERMHTEAQQKARVEAQWNEMEKRQQLHRARTEQWKARSGGKTFAEFRQAVRIMEEEWLGSQAKQKNLEQERSRIVESQQKLVDGLDRCPLCEQPLNEAAVGHVRRERQERLRALEEELKTIETGWIKLRSARENAREISAQGEILIQESERSEEWEKERLQAQEKRRVLEQTLRELEETRKRTGEENERIRKEWETARMQLQEMERQRTRKHELEKAKQELEKWKVKMQGLVVEEAAYEQARKQLEESQIMYEKYRGELRVLEERLRSLEAMQRVLQEEIQRQEEMEKEIAYRLQIEEQLMQYKNAVLETQMLLRSSLIGAINAALNEIWKIFYPYGNYKELRMRVDEKDYVLEVLEDSWKPLETMASGGERSCAALTLRVALATVLTPNLSWLILDEPTHNLDKQAVELLAQTLQFKVPEVVKQTFVITHEEALMGSDFASSYKLSRDKTNAGATKVERI